MKGMFTKSSTATTIATVVAASLLVYFLHITLNRAQRPNSQLTDVPVTPGRAVGKETAMSTALSVLNQQPITFFGTVVDQDGAAVEGVTVTGGIMIKKEWTDGHIEKHQTISDSQGRFTFRNLSGRDISIWLDKPGYRFDNRMQNTLFKYSLLTPLGKRHNPDRGAPARFVLWKERGQGGTVKLSIENARVPVDGTPIFIDLVAGQIVASGGDLALALTRKPLQIERGQIFDWTLTLTSPDGGLIPFVAGYAFEAPEGGYEKSLIIERRADLPNWQRSDPKTFYLRSRNGLVHAIVTVTIYADNRPPVNALINAFVNPTGSRTLEY